MLRSHLAFLVALTAFTTDTRGAQVCHTVSIPLTTPTWNQSISIPRFDSVSGTLHTIQIQFAVHLEGSCGFESLDAGPAPVTAWVSATMRLNRPDSSNILTAYPTHNLSFLLSPYDGVLDFSGPSGHQVSGISIDVVPSPTIGLNSAADRALFTGPTGNPGSIVLGVGALGASGASAPGSLITQFSTQTSCVVTVCYLYSPAVTSFCVGTNATCPCGNGSFSHGGCANSGLGGVGAALTNDGIASVGADTLLLYAANMPPNASTLIFQGTTRVNGGVGAVFGDGLRCAGGATTRLGVRTAVAGVASYPGLGDAPVSLRGFVSAGDVRTYQAWYRDVANYCTPDTFNLTQGLEVRWAL